MYAELKYHNDGSAEIYIPDEDLSFRNKNIFVLLAVIAKYQLEVYIQKNLKKEFSSVPF